MIMPSEEEVKAEVGHGSVGNVTQPFVTETYRCVSQYETKDTKNKPFKVAADEKVDVLIKDKAGEPHSRLGRAAEGHGPDASNLCSIRLVAGGERGKEDGLVPGALPGEAGGGRG